MLLDWTLDTAVSPELLCMMQMAADRTISAEGIHLPCSASIRFCDNVSIQKINKQYRGIDSTTDVLSFPSVTWPCGKTAGQSPESLQRAYDPENGTYFLGDVVINAERIHIQASEYGHSEEREAAYLLVHSLCHLMGYDHMNEKEKTVMRKKEEEILSSIGMGRDETSHVSDEVLLDLARDAMSRSYSPYSRYPVGAALHSIDGRIFLGCNIENASFGATICAERTAMAKAVSEGATEFDVIAIATTDTPGWPCGICRQFMSEFAPNLRVLVTWGNGKYLEESTLLKILPYQFDLKGKEE